MNFYIDIHPPRHPLRRYQLFEEAVASIQGSVVDSPEEADFFVRWNQCGVFSPDRTIVAENGYLSDSADRPYLALSLGGHNGSGKTPLIEGRWEQMELKPKPCQDTGDWIVVDFKSSSRAQADDITSKQLQVYALGFEQLTGTRPKLIEVHNLDDGGIDRRVVSVPLIKETLQDIALAGHQFRSNNFPRLKNWTNTCTSCDFSGICREQNEPH